MCFDPVHSLEVNTFSGLKQKSVYLNFKNQVLAQQVGPYLLDGELEPPPLKRNCLQKLFGPYYSQGQVKTGHEYLLRLPRGPGYRRKKTRCFSGYFEMFLTGRHGPTQALLRAASPPVHARALGLCFARSRTLAHVCLDDSEDNTLTQVILLQSCLGQNLQTQRLLLSKQDLFLPVTSFRDEGKDFPQPTAFSVQTLHHNILKLQKS